MLSTTRERSSTALHSQAESLSPRRGLRTQPGIEYRYVKQPFGEICCPEGAIRLSPGFQPWGARGFNPGELSPQAIRLERARDDYMINAGKCMFSPCSVWRSYRARCGLGGSPRG